MAGDRAFELTLAEWDGLGDPEALSTVREVERRVPRARHLRFEQTSRRVAVFDVAGVEMVLVPGGLARLGFDLDLLDESAAEAWARSFRSEGHVAQQIAGRGPDLGRRPPPDMVAALRDAMTEPRDVEVRAFLLERTSERDVARDRDDDPHVAMAKAVVAEDFRLPTSDEWEYASAGGTRALFRWGNRWPYETEVDADRPELRAPNAFGLRYRDDPYHSEVVEDPWELRAGDGGQLVCGESGPIHWVTFASAFRYRISATDSREHWLQKAHVRRALSITPQEGDGRVRALVLPTVFEDAGLAVQELTRLLDGGGDLGALPDLDRLARAHPNEARVHVAIAHGHRKLGRLDAAEAAARTALGLSRSVGPLTTLAAVLRDRGDLDAAVALYDEAIALKPSDVGLYTAAGDALRGAGRFAEAARLFARALEADGRAGYARVMRAYCAFCATGDAAEAETIVDLARGPAKGVAFIEALADEVAPGWRA